MAYGITSQGYVRKPLSAIITSMQTNYRALAGNDIDLSIYTIEGQLIQVAAQELDSGPWQANEDTYYSAFPDTASGVSLDRIGALANLPRQPAIAATVIQTVFGASGSDVPIGFQVQTPSGILFANQSDFAIGASGSATGTFIAVIAGPTGVQPASGISQIANPLPGLASTINLAPSFGGLLAETDNKYRQRYKARRGGGATSVPAIADAILAVAGVTSCVVNENYTEVTVGGLPPNSIHVVVSGTFSNLDLANAIFAAKPAGVQPIGTKSQAVTDSGGISYTMWWDVAAQTEILMGVVVTRNSAWVTGNEVPLMTAIVRYVGGVDTVNGIATNYTGVGPGVDITRFAVGGAVFDAGITGIEDLAILLCLKPGTPNHNTLSMNGNQYAYIITADIAVTLA